MHHLDLGLFNYQVTYTRELLKEFCDQIAINKLDIQLAGIPRFPGLKIFKNGLGNIKRFTADEFRNMMKVFVFVTEGIITKHHKSSIDQNDAKWYDIALVKVFYRWNKMYLYSKREHFSESDLVEFKVGISPLYCCIYSYYVAEKVYLMYFIGVDYKLGNIVCKTLLKLFAIRSLIA